MRILFAVIPIFLALLFASDSRADWPTFPFVHAEGEAELEVPPENATVRFTVATFHQESAVALETLQAQVAKALDVLAEAKVPQDRITGFDLQKFVERAQDDDYNELEILGYHLSRHFEVELTDLKMFSPLVAELMALDNVSPVNAEFDIENRDEIESRLVLEAAQDARRRAEDMARSMGVSIESVFAISETPIASIERTFRLSSDSYSVSAFKIDARFQDQLFKPDTIEFRKSVNVLFKLQEL